ncbi:MAG TPA: bifunctional diaminohydroxyphosphoribosylaminopyrimidine deaminase/5-amino-6-(5-phosphoribosylamino)uracil reductase RibD [Acidimicrobiia bacterium]|nr:bifunctional diaminohydroxyphosphoribosylaminopyrimidine deaminase/5-amino-6-(5-phosphoribosylamino)uracil reductase RibD [Acidimicrobiia bacterium]
MHRAIELAQEWLHTHPNPRVGSVVTDASGDIVGEGWHRGPGTDHAEIVALRAAGDRARGGTAYTTLEPCTHHGRTPPCVDALLEAGVGTVVVGVIDPDPRVFGAGVERLREAGIEVITGVAESAAGQVDPAYFHHHRTGMPMVTVKWAMTLDGSVAATDGSSQWITGDETRQDAHRLRATVDGVVIAAGTLREDDPSLDVRLDGYEGPQPRPVVIAGKTPLPSVARIWERDPMIVSSSARDIPSGELVQVPAKGDHPDPVATCRALLERGLLHLLLEGGPTIARAWWREGVITDGVVYVGSRIGGGTGRSPMAGVFANITDAVDVEFESVLSVGTDAVITFTKKRN